MTVFKFDAARSWRRLNTGGAIFALAFIWILFAALPARTQGIRTTISGKVTDGQGNALPGVKVSAINRETNERGEETTNADGNYFLRGLNPGPYRVETALPGFGTNFRDVDAQVDQQLYVALTVMVVRPGNLPKEDAPLTIAPGIERWIGRWEAVGLPLSTRQYDQLALLFPGTFRPAYGSHLASRGGFVIGGLDEHYLSHRLDGSDNGDPVVRGIIFRPSLDFIEEFKFQQTGGNAELGRNGGGVINATTRRGTNVPHLSAWEYLRNDNLDARNAFALSQVAKPVVIRNQFGFAYAGPIRKNKTFLFAGYEGLRQREGLARLATVPTMLMRNGDLSELGGGVIPSSSIDPIALEVLQAYPLPTLNGTTANRVEIGNRIDNSNDFTIRFDHPLPLRTQLNVRFSSSRTRIIDPFRSETGFTTNLAGFGQSADRFRTNTGISLTTPFGKSKLNELRLGYTRFRQPVTPLTPGTPLQEPLMGVERTFLTFFIRGLDPLGSASQFNRAVNVYNVVDHMSWTMGNHQLKTGVDVRRYLFNFVTLSPNLFAFTGFRTGTLIGLADFLQGLPTETNSYTGSPGGSVGKTEFAAFLQDDWKVTSNLTVNAGLRWDYFGRIREKTNKQSMWLKLCNCMAVAGTDVSEQLVEGDFNNFAPRLGFAYQPFGKKDWVIRGFGGLFYDNDMRHNAELVSNPPFMLKSVYSFFAFPGLTLAAPFPGSAPVLAPMTIDRQYRDTYVESWSLSVQRELARKTTVELAYVGNHSVKARRTRNVNQAIGGSVPYAGFTTITAAEQAGSSSFNSLQARVERRVLRDFTFGSSYTWSHAIDDRPVGYPQDSYNPGLDRADSDFDVRHRWVSHAQWEIPVGRNRRWGNNWETSKPILDRLFRNWNLSGIAGFESGRPVNVFVFNSRSAPVIGTFASDRPNAVPGVDWRPPNQSSGQWINPAAFSLNAFSTFGNVGRNTLRGPGFANFDFALLRTEAINERINIQFRAEFFNAFNHTNLGQPASFLDDLSSFGRITSTVAPGRQIQFGLRLEY